MSKMILVEYQKKINDYRQKGDYLGALSASNEMVELGEREDNTSLIMAGYLHLGVSYYYIGDHMSAIKNLILHYDLVTDHGQQADHLNAYNLMAVVYIELKEYQKAKAQLAKTMELAEKLNSGNILSNAYSNFCHCLIEEGLNEEAINYGRRAYEIALEYEPKNPLLIIRAGLNYAKALIFIETYDEADELIRSIGNLMDRESNLREYAQYLDLVGLYNEKIGEINQSIQAFDEACKLARKLDDIYLESEFMASLIRTAEKLEDYMRAYEAQKRYIRLFELIKKDETNKATVAFTMKNQAEELRNISYEDPLTKVYNRRFLDKKMRMFDPNEKISCILFDIDLFKQVNDQYGHLAGDRVIKKVAMCIKDQLRTKDVFCRYGGDEFLILLYDTDKDQAVKTAERIREKVEALKIDIENRGDVSVTLSIGVSDNKLHNPKNAKELIHYADLGLYKAKELGRNRVEVVNEIYIG